ncbi:MAG: CcoQ/FixQ family Cbb3-type cytochrome c oxidase assembly chaperone [Gammaproteobacteria bacterium]|nr:MAG: CcoQ/FixQ family Cbb3-type cytochrome c oxidase assembly chaperone [Gammaproteobacteria bacterium]
MDIGTIRGLLTAVLLILFLGIVAWSWSRKRTADFDAASRLPLDEGKQPPRKQHHREHLS